MVDLLLVPKRPCSTCPYSRSTPSGLWAACEYERLATYDEPGGALPNLNAFHCHQQNVTKVDTICRGWLGVHSDAPAVRLLAARGLITRDDIPTEEDPTLYSSGTEAMEAGLVELEAPSAKARAAMLKLVQRRGSSIMFESEG